MEDTAITIHIIKLEDGRYVWELRDATRGRLVGGAQGQPFEHQCDAWKEATEFAYRQLWCDRVSD